MPKKIKHCALVFRNPQCGYAGESSTCNKTPAYCRGLGNFENFVAFDSDDQRSLEKQLRGNCTWQPVK